MGITQGFNISVCKSSSNQMCHCTSSPFDKPDFFWPLSHRAVQDFCVIRLKNKPSSLLTDGCESSEDGFGRASGSNRCYTFTCVRWESKAGFMWERCSSRDRSAGSNGAAEERDERLALLYKTEDITLMWMTMVTGWKISWPLALNVAEITACLLWIHRTLSDDFTVKESSAQWRITKP